MSKKRRQFPRALNKPAPAPLPSPDGRVQVDVSVQDGFVALSFGAPVASVRLLPEQAVAMAQAILQCANKARAQKKIVLVRPDGIPFA